MSSNAYTAKFMEKVPLSPVSQQIAALHSMAYYAGMHGDALAMFEHHLYSIGVYSHDRYRDSQPPHLRIPEVPHQPQPDRLTEGLLMIPDKLRFPETPMISPKAMTEAFAKMGDAVAAMKTRLKSHKNNPTDSEASRTVRLAARIEDQREIGLAHVTAEAARVRRELGL